MAEVFQGTPSIVTVAISDQEGHKTEYNVCGKDMDQVKDVVRAALAALPNGDDEESYNKPKAKRKRRTKAELTAQEAIDSVTPSVGETETVGSGHRRGKVWTE